MIIFYHLKIYNKELLTECSDVIIACNHISWFDPPFIASICPFEVAILAKVELFKNAIFGKIISSLNAIPINRGLPDKSAIKRVFERLSNNKSLLLFPEGTRNGTSIKAGLGLFALSMKKNILPVYIENSGNFFSCFFFRKRLIIKIGNLIKIEDFQDLELNRQNYQHISEYTFKKIMELKNG